MPLSEMLDVAGFLVTLGVAVRISVKEVLSPRNMYLSGIWAIFGALFGGYFVNAILHSADYSIGLFNILNGPKCVFGAIAGAAIASSVYLRWKQAAFLLYSDAAAPAVALGYFVTRISCFLNGDDFGTLATVPWAVTFGPGTEAFADHVRRGWVSLTAASSLPVHPTQLYHAAVGLILFAWLSRWRGTWQGSRFALALAGYGVSRFFLQFFRGDSVPIAAGLDDSQIFSILFFIAACFLWLKRGREKHTTDGVDRMPESPGISLMNVQ